jgi:hypothetical protein
VAEWLPKAFLKRKPVLYKTAFSLKKLLRFVGGVAEWLKAAVC